MAVLLSKETLAQSREHVPILTERIDILLGNATKHGGIHVPTFGTFRGIHISGNIEVVIVLPNLINAHQTAELIDITIPRHRIHDAFDIARTQLVVLAFLGEVFGSVHDEHMIVVAMFAQHHHDGGDAGAEEDVRGQADDGLNVVFLHQVPANSAFLTATEQHAMWQHDGHNAIITQVIEIMQQEGIISLGLRRNAIFETDIFARFRRLPVLGVGRIRDHGVHKQRLIGLVLRFVGIEPWPVAF